MKLKHVASIKERAGGGKYHLWDSASIMEKKRLWGKSVLEENIQTVAFTTSGSQRLHCVGIYSQSSERKEGGRDLRLSARKLYWCRLHFSSACLVRMFCIITEAHKCMSIQAHFNALFYSAHPNTFVLVSSLQNTQNETCIEIRSHYTKRL